MTEESDGTDTSFDSKQDDCRSLAESQTSESSIEFNVKERIRMAEDIKSIEKKSRELFKTSQIPFKFDPEDFQNYMLNAQIKKELVNRRVTLPVVHIAGTDNYFVGFKVVRLSLDGDYVKV